MNEPIFDEKDAMDRLGGDSELLMTIIGVFLEACEEQVQRLHQAINTADYKSAYREAHSIKGAAANISAQRIRTVAAELEKEMAESNPENADQLFNSLQEEIEVFKTIIADRDT